MICANYLEGLFVQYQIAQHGIGGRDESWWYVEFNTETKEAFWVYEWNNLSYSLKTDAGERKVPLAEAKGEQHYASAIAMLREKHPEWPGFED